MDTQPAQVPPAEASPVIKKLLETQIAGTLSEGNPDHVEETGPQELLSRPDVDVVLTPSRDRPIAGELWSLAGEIHNRSKATIWIVDRKTVLTLAPEMWGQTSQRGSMGAFFPTVRSRPTDEVVRIDPGAKYVVVWKVNTLEQKEDANSVKQVFRRMWSALKDFTFFNPGLFAISSTVHVWSVPPRFGASGDVINVGESYPISVTKEIEMEASPWVLIFGAAVGGVLCFILQMLFGIVSVSESVGVGLKTIVLGLCTATLLCGVVTVLVSRLAKADFLLIIKVNDIWGAITSGFVIQWFGYSALIHIVPQASGG